MNSTVHRSSQGLILIGKAGGVKSPYHMKINKKDFSSSWASVPHKALIYSTLALSLLNGAFAAILIPYLPPQLPLFYGKPIGEEQLVRAVYFLIAPAVSLFINLINVLLVMVIGDLFTRKVLIFTGFFVAALIAITTTRIILLVGFF